MTTISSFSFQMASINKMFATLETDMSKLDFDCKIITKELMEKKGNADEVEIITIDDTDQIDLNKVFSFY